MDPTIEDVHDCVKSAEPSASGQQNRKRARQDESLGLAGDQKEESSPWPIDPETGKPMSKRKKKRLEKYQRMKAERVRVKDAVILILLFFCSMRFWPFSKYPSRD